jgi:hypothetical protein
MASAVSLFRRAVSVGQSQHRLHRTRSLPRKLIAAAVPTGTLLTIFWTLTIGRPMTSLRTPKIPPSPGIDRRLIGRWVRGEGMPDASSNAIAAAISDPHKHKGIVADETSDLHANASRLSGRAERLHLPARPVWDGPLPGRAGGLCFVQRRMRQRRVRQRRISSRQRRALPSLRRTRMRAMSTPWRGRRGLRCGAAQCRSYVPLLHGARPARLLGPKSADNRALSLVPQIAIVSPPKPRFRQILDCLPNSPSGSPGVLRWRTASSNESTPVSTCEYHQRPYQVLHPGKVR